MNKFIASSVDPKQLSLTIKSALIMIVPLVGIAIKAAGHQVDQEQLRAAVELAADAIVALGSFISIAGMAIGALRRLAASV